MNILFIPSWYPNSENETNGIFFKEQAHALLKNNVNIFILSLNTYYFRNIFNYLKLKKKIDFYNDNGIKTYIINYLNIFPRFKYLFFIYSSLKLKHYYQYIIDENSIKFDLIHIHSIFNAGIFYYLSKIPINYIITEHVTFFSRNMLSFLDKYFVKKVLLSAKRIISVGNGLKDELSKYTDKNIDIIYNMVSLNKSNCKLDLNKKYFRFFSLGEGLYKKGFDILVTAFKNSNICDKAELIIAGLTEKEIKKLKKMFKVNNIKLLGIITREEVSFNFYNCDCFVLPSRFETFGVVFAEAMYFGKPVIASVTGGPDSFITPETGMLVPVNNTYETMLAMENMYLKFSNYDNNHIMEYANSQFSENIISNKIIKIYQDAV